MPCTNFMFWRGNFLPAMHLLTSRALWSHVHEVSLTTCMYVCYCVLEDMNTYALITFFSSLFIKHYQWILKEIRRKIRWRRQERKTIHWCMMHDDIWNRIKVLKYSSFKKSTKCKIALRPYYYNLVSIFLLKMSLKLQLCAT